MNRICIEFKLLDDGSYPELPEMSIKDAAEIIGQHTDWDTNTWRLYLSHPYFPEYEAGNNHVRISYELARVRYPFLFAYTNPLLYKKFYSSRSWYLPSRYFMPGKYLESNKASRVLGYAGESIKLGDLVTLRDNCVYKARM